MGKLVLIRHGQSIWNLQNRFTGWINVSLSKKGQEEAANAGKKLKDYKFDIAFTSTLTRAQETLFKILEQNNNYNGYMIKPQFENEWYHRFKENDKDNDILWVNISEKLNERFYGDLQGLNKDDAKKEFGDNQVHIWRRSYDVPPPNGESLEMNVERTIPYFKEYVEKELKEGKNVLVAAHGNSLRSIIKYLDNMSPEEILNFELDTGIPHIYEFDEKLNIINKETLN